jgi:hypothetical protein
MDATTPEINFIFFNEYSFIMRHKIENYYSKGCEATKSIEISPNLNYVINFEKPIITIDIKYFKFLVKKYVVTCVDSKISDLKVTNVEEKRKEFILMDDNASSSNRGLITLRDSLGIPIWWLEPNMLTFQNKKFIRFNDPKLIDHGKKIAVFASTNGGQIGEYLIYDLLSHSVTNSYTGRKNTKEVGDLDWHDLQFLPNGEAVGIRYLKRNDVNLSSIGIPQNIDILDSEIVLLNVDGTEKKSYSIMDLITKDEIPSNQKIYFTPTIGPVDVIHTNSIEIQGDFAIISSRHLDAIHKIDLKSGSIVWRLGGHSNTPNDLRVLNSYGSDLSDGNLQDFTQLLSSQHDARVLKSGELSVFDNGTTANRNPRVLVFEINETEKTAKISKVITSSSMNTSFCCGSARELSDGSWMINYGGRLSGGSLVNSISATILNSGVETHVLTRPDNEFSYRAIPYYLTREQIDIFRNDLINRGLN